MAQSNPSKETYMGRRVSQTLQFLSPLQSLTIFPKEVQDTSTTHRDEFLPKFKSGLEAEKRATEYMLKQRELEDDDDEFVGKGWEQRTAESERLRAEKEDQFVEQAYDRAVTAATSAAASSKSRSAKGKASTNFQFVGVVQPPGSEKKVKWYARKRPSTQSKWNVRLIHANKDVITRDLFVNGKIDVVAKYNNTGKRRDELKEGENPSAPSRPLIEADYNIKSRSMWNLWNFSPKHFFNDSSGSFWRERRLPSGLYTDGSLVYESKYRYSDGKNGMKAISKLDALLRSKSVKESVKLDLLKRLEKDSPDIVIEE